MFKFFKKEPATPAEVKLQQIQDLLFPPLEEQMEGDMSFYVDYSVDSNIESAIYDLEEGHNDETVRKTLKAISNKLFKARKILQAYQEIDKNIGYVVTDDGYRETEISHRRED
jgi:hypothetical protein